MGLNRGSFSYARGLERLFSEGTLTGLGSGALLERYLATGDEAAFEAIVAQHGPMVLGLCRRMLSDPRDVEDAFQAVFMILAQSAGRVRNPNRLSSWLYGVAYKVAARARDQAARVRARESPITEIEDARNREVSLLDRFGPVLDHELSRLPEKYRSALLLCYLKGRTHDQAAQELACPVGTIRSRLARGRDILRKRLVERGCAPAVALLDGGSISSIRWIGEGVSAALITRTTRAAVQFGSYKSASAAAGAVALTQGVLMSMKIASLKLATLAFVIGGVAVSAGGLAAVRLVGAAPAQSPAVAVKPQTLARPQARARSLEDRIASIEDKLGTLLSQRAADGQDDAPADARPRAALSASAEASMTVDFATFRAIREAEAKLKIAIRSFNGIREAIAKGSDSAEGFLEPTREIGLIAVAGLQGFVDGFEYQAAIVEDRIKLLNRKSSEARDDRDRALDVVKRETGWSGNLQEILEQAQSNSYSSRGEQSLRSTLNRMEMIEEERAPLDRRHLRLLKMATRIRQLISDGDVFQEPAPPSSKDAKPAPEQPATAKP